MKHQSPNPVHPRLRGELFSVANSMSDEKRFIPAYAGNSPDWPDSKHPVPVHPRLRGELCQRDTVVSGSDGSSPLTRGTLTEFLWPRLSMRFIPAYAGNSSRISGILPESPVHPRLRGELSAWACAIALLYGSSPLTRGTRLWQILSERLDTVHPRLRGELAQEICRDAELERFIPAYAGNSSIRWNISMILSVHPRLRGELT